MLLANVTSVNLIFKKILALAGVAQWIGCWYEGDRQENILVRIAFSHLAGVAPETECRSVNQRIAGSIPSQGTCLGCRPGPHLGAHER